MNAFTRLAAVLGLILLTQPAAAEDFSCHIGKPSYCSKYGTLCLAWNNAADTPAACEKWTAGCFACTMKFPAAWAIADRPQ